MEQAYFNNIRSKIISLLNDAENEVTIAMAWFTSCELFDELMACRERDVAVKLILMDTVTNFMYYAPDFNKLIAAGGEVRVVKMEDGLMHHKFCVIDGRLVITGSYNWTYYAETRNIENILVTDNSEAVRLYQEEFVDLFERTEKTTECPRLSWEDMEECRNIDYDELNYEITSIAKSRNLPEYRVVRPSAKIAVVELSKNPVSRYNIGLRVTTGENNNAMKTFIKSGERLPHISQEFTLYNPITTRNNAVCDVVYECNEQIRQIKAVPITRITSNSTKECLTIKTLFTLDPAGHLEVQLNCVETGLAMYVKCDEEEFVEYEK